MPRSDPGRGADHREPSVKLCNLETLSGAQRPVSITSATKPSENVS